MLVTHYIDVAMKLNVNTQTPEGTKQRENMHTYALDAGTLKSCNTR